MSTLFDEIEFEIGQIEMLLANMKPLIDYCKVKTPDYIYCSAIASNIHAFYNGIEKIFIRINKNIDDVSFSNSASHSELLDFMSKSTKARPAAITEETKNVLADYMRFRHFFRHSYTFNISWEKLSPLILNIEKNWQIVKTEIQAFSKWSKQL